MAISEAKKREYVRRLLLSRLRILTVNGFYGMLLMHISFGLDSECETAYTDGRRIVFSPLFLEELSDEELDFVMMHEIMHIALQHCFRGYKLESERFNIACDIVVNSNILLSNGMDVASITIRGYGESMHIAPDGKEGYNYTAEEVYEMLGSPFGKPMKGKGSKSNDNNGKKDKSDGTAGDGSDNGFWDDHHKWTESDDDDILRDEWVSRVINACEVISIRESTKNQGGPPLWAQRLVKEASAAQIDWRTVLNEFVQEEINDYSFYPPDRRFGDSPFFLPDFNEKDERVKNVWFLIDTSGSISDDELAAAYGEIKSAIEQFNGCLEGMLSFTETSVTDPIPFDSVESLMEIKPVGGGGNDFSAIFRYMQENMADEFPAYIIIITDGYDRFPKESEALGIPVLWLINNDDVTPPWGKVARIKI